MDTRTVGPTVTAIKNGTRAATERTETGVIPTTTRRSNASTEGSETDVAPTTGKTETTTARAGTGGESTRPPERSTRRSPTEAAALSPGTPADRTAETARPPTSGRIEAFVSTDGTDLVVDGEPFSFTGVCNGPITGPYSTRKRVDEIIEEAAALGMHVLRVWAFCNGTKEGGRCFQPRPGEYGKRAFERFDYVIAKAKRHGIRLIPALVNNWDPIGSMKQYVRWSDTAPSYPNASNGEGKVHDAFYTDEGARELFMEYVEHVLTRENTITGVEYRNEPTIMMWELANEPQARTADPSVLQHWIEEMSRFIQATDPNHLVSTGSEGFYSGRQGGWMYDGYTGSDFIANHRPSSVDVCSFHCWPDHWNISVSEGTRWIEQHVREAHERLGKPVYLGEFGWPVDRSGSQGQALRRRNEVFRTWYDALDEAGCNGSAVWTLRGHAYNETSGDGSDPPLYRFNGPDADPYAIYHPEDESTTKLLEARTTAP
jgi:mannan endo-1,4-beta-mannosidase